MPEQSRHQRRVLYLWQILRDHKISCSVISRLFWPKSRPKYIRDMLSGKDPVSPERRRKIEAFLKFIRIPESEISRSWDWHFIPGDALRSGRPDPVRLKKLLGLAEKFNTQYQSDNPSPKPEPVNLLDVEVPVLERKILSVAACKFFEFIDREGNALDPFWQEYKDPDNYEAFAWPGYQAAFEEMMRAARQRAMLALVAPPVAGKTFLFSRVRRALQKKGYLICEPRLLTKSKLTEGALLNAILAEIAEDPGFKPKSRIADRCDQIFELLTVKNKGMKKVALAIDEAQELPPLALRCLKRLHDWHYGVYDNLLSIFLIGHPLLRSNLLDNLMIEETARRTIIYELAPLDSITDFLNWRLSRALGRPYDCLSLFAGAGLAAFTNLLDDNNHTRRYWRPMIICNLAVMALERAYSLGENQISEAIVGEIYDAARER